jgi:hypothetical protein
VAAALEGMADREDRARIASQAAAVAAGAPFPQAATAAPATAVAGEPDAAATALVLLTTPVEMPGARAEALAVVPALRTYKTPCLMVVVRAGMATMAAAAAALATAEGQAAVTGASAVAAERQTLEVVP